MKNNPHISICIPTYEMGGKGPEFLRQSFDILIAQTFTDFNIIISDNAEDGSIKKVCDEYMDRLSINYYKHAGAKEMCANTNNAMKHADGSIIKILFMDDFLYSNDSLEIISNNFDLKEDSWLASACIHTKNGKDFYKVHYPTYHNYIQYGRNTIGTPSIITIKNEDLIFFDSKFKLTLQDCDYYKRLGDKFGKPKIIKDITVVIRIHAHSVTSTQANAKAYFDELFIMLKNQNKHLFSHPEILWSYLKIWIKKILKKL